MINNPITCASRKRGDVHKLETSGEVANSITTIDTDSMVLSPEPQCLTTRRTELGRRLRKQGQPERFANKEYIPRKDGICNTITHVEKDYMLAEPNRGGYFTKENLSEKEMGYTYPQRITSFAEGFQM